MKLFLSKKLCIDYRNSLSRWLEDEAKKYAKILGYNYNSSEWFEQSYKILNSDYKLKKRKSKYRQK